MATHTLLLTLLFVVATLSTAMTVRGIPDQSIDTWMRWGLLYAVAVVVPTAWSLYHVLGKRADARLAVAPAYVGTAVLFASLSFAGPQFQGAGLVLALWTGLALAVTLAIRGAARWLRHGR